MEKPRPRQFAGAFRFKWIIEWQRHSAAHEVEVVKMQRRQKVFKFEVP